MTNTKYLMLSLISMILFNASCKTSETSKVMDTADQVTMADAKDEKSLLWEISGNNLTESSYLFGTIHMIESKDYFLPQGTLSAIDATSKMMFEIDMADMSDPMKLMPLLQKAYMKGDTTLKDLVTPEDYALVEAKFQEIGMPLFLLERIKPMFLSVFATGDFDPQGMENGTIKSYEMEFAKMAEDGDKSTGGLESIEYQIGIFDAIPYKDQADMLMEAIKSTGTDDDSFVKLVNLYKDQDVHGLFEMMKEDDSIEEFEDVLLFQRNRNWIPIMAEEMKKERVFFAVGAGHLGGDMGVINLLRKQGYKVSAVKS